MPTQDKKKTLIEVLAKIQRELKAPKSQENDFAHFNYRSCEDILEAVKPLLGEVVLIITDEIVFIGERHYVKAHAVLQDADGTQLVNTAFAREPLEKKGMDASQITGTASSYARKYALNGLFLIDDTKDADSSEHTAVTTRKAPAAARPAAPRAQAPAAKAVPARAPAPARTAPAAKPAPAAQATAPSGSPECAECAKVIAANVQKFSISKFKRPLCFDCQKLAQ